MNKDNKKALYESIMMHVAKEVKKALNEGMPVSEWVELPQYREEFLEEYDGDVEDLDLDDYDDSRTVGTYIEKVERHRTIKGLYKIYVYCNADIYPNININNIPDLPGMRAIIFEIGDQQPYSYESYSILIYGTEDFERAYDIDNVIDAISNGACKLNNRDIPYIEQCFNTNECSALDLDDSTRNLLIFV